MVDEPTTDTTPDAPAPVTEPGGAAVAEETLVEEVSIDGMCGVY